jgi:integrase
MGAEEVQAYITYLANERRVAASTQNPSTEPACSTQCCRSEAISAIIFLYKYVLQKEIILSDILRPGRPDRLPTVLSHPEAMSVIGKMRGTPKIIVQLLYGSGLRITECLRLRVKDLDFTNHQRIVRDGKACPEPACDTQCCRRGRERPGDRPARFVGTKLEGTDRDQPPDPLKGLEGGLW